MLQQRVRQYAREYWNMECNVPIVINKRMTRSLGMYRWKTARPVATPIRFDFAAHLVDGRYKSETVESIIKHEVCHWALSQLGLPFHDRDHHFLKELKRIGSHPSFAILEVGTMHKAVCSCCGKIVKQSLKEKSLEKYYKHPKWHSRCCKAAIIYGGCELKEDNTKPVIPLHEYKAPPIIAHTQKSAMTGIKQTMPIEDVIQPGPKGITNFQMIPAIKDAITEGSKEKLVMLRTFYPGVYESSLKYIGKGMTQLLHNII